MSQRARSSSRWFLAIVVALATSTHVTTAGASPPSGEWAFDVPPLTPEVYAIQEPNEDPTLQRRWVRGADNERLFVETWLPKARDGRAPAKLMPTVLVMSPYAQLGRIPDSAFNLLDEAVPRGYAYSVMHVRGTGESGGCFDHHGDIAVEDGVRVIEHVSAAPWSDGRIALAGLSAPGAEAIAVAAEGSPDRIASVKALVVGAPADAAQTLNHDGVQPWVDGLEAPYYAQFGVLPGNTPMDVALGASQPQDFIERRLAPGGFVSPNNLNGRYGCTPEHVIGAADESGNVNDYARERMLGLSAHNITKPTFMFHGFQDLNIAARIQTGLFDRISAPKVGIFGVFGHVPPDSRPGLEPGWERSDFRPMVMAWLDRWVRGIDTGVEQWPVAQIQSSDGQWRAEGDWPTTGGPVGQLALSAGAVDGVLGSTTPTGRSSFIETQNFDRTSSPVQLDVASVEFRSPALEERLHITGQIVLDAWLVTDKDDAHIGAELHAYDANGDPIPYGSVSGFRSLRHLDPIENGVFVQSEERVPSVNTPIRVPIRFNPVDVVVPKGGHLELRVAGSVRWGPGIPLFEHPSRPSGSNSTVTVLHDCEHPTTLRFLMPRGKADLIDVREFGETELGSSGPRSRASVPDGGLARREVCGQSPQRVEGVHGEAFDYRWRPQAGGTPMGTGSALAATKRGVG